MTRGRATGRRRWGVGKPIDLSAFVDDSCPVPSHKALTRKLETVTGLALQLIEAVRETHSEIDHHTFETCDEADCRLACALLSEIEAGM